MNAMTTRRITIPFVCYRQCMNDACFRSVLVQPSTRMNTQQQMLRRVRLYSSQPPVQSNASSTSRSTTPIPPTPPPSQPSKHVSSLPPQKKEPLVPVSHRRATVQLTAALFALINSVPSTPHTPLPSSKPSWPPCSPTSLHTGPG